MGCLLTWGYKSTLLTTLVTIRYNKPINTLADLDRSGLPLVIIEGSSYHQAFESDQRDMMKRIYKKSFVWEPTLQNEAKTAAMYKTIAYIMAKYSIFSHFSGSFKI